MPFVVARFIGRFTVRITCLEKMTPHKWGNYKIRLEALTWRKRSYLRNSEGRAAPKSGWRNE